VPRCNGSWPDKHISGTTEQGYINPDVAVDLAVLQVKNSGPQPYLSFRTEPVLEGQNVTVIGNPKGFRGTVSTGIVSAVRKNGNLIQFTAPISNGSSGGPLLDDDGNVTVMADWVSGYIRMKG